MKIGILVATLFCLPTAAFAQGNCDISSDPNRYVENNAIQNFALLLEECDYTGKLSESGLPLAHEMARWGFGEFNLVHLSKADGLYEKDSNGNTALHHAAMKGGLDTVLYLLWLGFDANETNLSGETALELMQGNLFLYQNGVPTGRIVAELAKIDHSKFFVKGSDVPDDQCVTLCKLDGYTSVEEVMWAFLTGANPFSFDSNGFSSLHYAAYYGDTVLARALVQAGVDVNIATRDGKSETPLHSAAWAESPSIEMFQTLRDSGADPGAKDASGYAASFYIDSVAFVREASEGEDSLIEWLLSHRN